MAIIKHTFRAGPTCPHCGDLIREVHRYGPWVPLDEPPRNYDDPRTYEQGHPRITCIVACSCNAINCDIDTLLIEHAPDDILERIISDEQTAFCEALYQNALDLANGRH